MNIRERVQRARDIQTQRFDEPRLQLLEKSMTALKLSARAYDRILKVSRTIADLASQESIGSAAISEAINYRTLDREMWNRV